MKRFPLLLVVVFCVVGSGGKPTAAAEPAVSLRSLLEELIDVDHVARWPQPEFTCRQASSYDRASKTPDDPKTWFANGDQNQFIRSEKVGGRTEKVMLDADGPGAIVRFWITSGNEKKGAIRIYLDGDVSPTVTVPSYDFTNNDAIPAGKPLLTSHPGAEPKGRSGNTLFLPIPYARHCKITWEEGEKTGARYYQINCRTYPAGTKVETYSAAALEAAKPLRELVNKTLAEPPSRIFSDRTSRADSLEPGEELSTHLPLGPKAVRVLSLHLDSTDAQSLRSLVLRGSFDGEDAIWCPVGEFFGSGVGLNELHSWYRTVEKDGTLKCRWVMPYRESGRLVLQNLGKVAVTGVKLIAEVDPWTWDDRSMHFHANWRQQYPLATRPMSDWNYLTAHGRGVYVGDELCVMNPVTAWWGEGDEKVWVDGESFPSHFGTGSEDYYCYSWSDTRLFQTPFANQVRCDGPGNKGQTVVTRTRCLDAIPFTKSLKFDMEVWHWADCKVAYAATTYWYAIPGATSSPAPEPAEAARTIPATPPPFHIAGAIECEKLKIVAKSPATPTEVQSGALAEGEWSGGAQLWVRGNKPGNFVELRIPDAKPGPKKLTLYATKSWDYGILRFSVNGQTAGKDFDAYHPQPIPSGPIELGVFEPKDGAYLLRVEVVGANPESKNSKSFFGLDAITLTAP